MRTHLDSARAGLPDDWIRFYRLGRNPDDLDFVDSVDLLSDISHEDPAVVAHLRSIASRAQAVGLPVTLCHIDSPSILAIVFPAGSRPRPLFVDAVTAASVDAAPFEQYAYLDEYDGIWSETAKGVEVRVESAAPIFWAIEPTPIEVASRGTCQVE